MIDGSPSSTDSLIKRGYAWITAAPTTIQWLLTAVIQWLLTVGKTTPEEGGEQSHRGATPEVDADSRWLAVQAGDADYPEGERYKRMAWTYSTVRQLLVRSGRIRDVLTNRYYLKEQNARIAQARAEGDRRRWVRLQVAKIAIRIGEEPTVVAPIVLLTILLFTGLYLVVPGGTEPAAGPWELIAFSFATLLSGIFEVLKALDPLGVIEVFARFGQELQERVGVAAMKPVGAAELVAAVESIVGVLLVVPLLLRIVQRLRLYSQAAQGEGTGLLSWLFGN